MKTLIFILFFIIPFNVNSNENILKFLQKNKWVSVDKNIPFHILEFKKDKVIMTTIFDQSMQTEDLFIVKKEFKNNSISILVTKIIKDSENTFHYEIYRYFLVISKLSDNQIYFSIYSSLDDNEPYNEIFEIYK